MVIISLLNLKRKCKNNMQCIHNIKYKNLELVQHYNELVQRYKCFFGLLSRNWIIPSIILSFRSKNQFFWFQCFHFTCYTFFEKQPFPGDYFRKLFEKVTCSLLRVSIVFILQLKCFKKIWFVSRFLYLEKFLYLSKFFFSLLRFNQSIYNIQ